MYDFLICGAGFFGATIARKLTDTRKKCLVIDKNSHVAGMAFDEKVGDIIVSRHGAHILHTNSSLIWDFLCQFSEIIPFINKPKILSGNKVYSFPINLMTLHQLWGIITPKEAIEKLNSVRIPCKNPCNFEEWTLDKIGRELYELFIYNYTKKCWMREPRDLPSSIIQRLPIRLTYDENYFTTPYQGIPKYGYTKMVENILEGIQVELGVNLINWQNYAKHLIYSGSIDKFFNYEYGELEYNTLKFEYKTYNGDFQGNAVFNHVDASVPYIRTIEHKHFYNLNMPKHVFNDTSPTIVSYDIPVAFKEHPEPYYPIRNDKNSTLYNKYLKLKPQNVTFGGRLGDYQYRNIDEVVAEAIIKAEKLCI